MKGIIIFKSNNGSTEQYARWIQEKTGFDCFEQKKAKRNLLASYDTFIIGCPIYAGKHLLAKWVKKNWPLLEGKKIILFTTSGAPGDDPSILSCYETAYDEEIRNKVSYFPLGGRMVIDELKPFMRFMMKTAGKMIKDPEERKKMLGDVDRMDKAGIDPIVAGVK